MTRIMSEEKKCERIGKLNRFNNEQIFTCLELPIVYIHKPIGEWMCKSCANNLALNEEDSWNKLIDLIDKHSEIILDYEKRILLLERSVSILSEDLD